MTIDGQILAELVAGFTFATLYALVANKHVVKLIREVSWPKPHHPASDKSVRLHVQLSRSGAFAMMSIIPIAIRLELPTVIFVCAAMFGLVFGIAWCIQVLLAELFPGSTSRDETFASDEIRREDL